MSVQCTGWWRGEEAFAAPAYEAAARWIADALAARVEHADPARTGVYIATTDAGVEASLALWREALEHGADFANPRAFPWTLASSLAGHVAATIGARGPVVTLVGDAEAAVSAVAHAVSDLESKRVDLAIVGGADVSGERANAAFLLLTRASRQRQTQAAAVRDMAGAAAVFSAAIEMLERGEAVAIADDYEPVITLAPANRAVAVSR